MDPTMATHDERWLVTGASGLLGNYAIRYLSKHGQVFGVSRRKAGVENARYTSLVGDLADEGFVSSLIADVQPTHVLHTAGLVGHEVCSLDPDQAYRSNVLSTRNLARHAGLAGAKIIYISTDAVYGGTEGGHRETEAPSPFSVYGQTKLAGEQEALVLSDALVIRTNFFGWPSSGGSSILTFFLKALRNQTEVDGFDDFVVSSLYAGSLISIVERLTKSNGIGIYNVGSIDAMSKYEFGISVANVFGLDPNLVLRRSASELRSLTTSRVRNLSLDLTKLRETLGDIAPTQLEGLELARSEEAQFL
jgi:dTDP-4-dehydrorhamnose reductase